MLQHSRERASTTSETAPLFPCCCMGCVWRSHVSFCALCPHFHTQLVLVWPFGAAFQNLYFKNIYFLNFLVFFLLKWCSLKVQFVFQHTPFFSAAVPELLFVVFFKHNLAVEDVLHPTSCSDVKLLIKQHLTEENQDYQHLWGSLSLCAALLESSFHPICSEPAGKWKSQASALHLFVCTSKCSHGQELCLWCSWIYDFVLLFLPDEFHEQGETAPKYHQEYFVFGSFSLRGGTFWSLLKSRELSHCHPLFWCIILSKNEKFEWREQEVLVQQPNPQQEICWVANLWSSNWLRKNWNVSKCPPEINGDCLYFGPGADWNWDNKWECLIPKEWELAALHRLSFWGRRNNQGLRFPLQQELGRLNMCQISLWFAFYILKRSWIFLCPCSQALVGDEVLLREL